MSICFCASGCGCSGYAEGPFHLRGSCTCWCHDKTCGCRLHRERREASTEDSLDGILDEIGATDTDRADIKAGIATIPEPIRDDAERGLVEFARLLLGNAAEPDGEKGGETR